MQRYLVVLIATVGVSLNVIAASAETSDHSLAGVTNVKSLMGSSTGTGSGLAALKSDNASALAPKAPSDKMISKQNAVEPEAIGKPKMPASKLTPAMLEAQRHGVDVKNNGLAALQAMGGGQTASSDPATQQLLSGAAKTSPPERTRNFLR